MENVPCGTEGMSCTKSAKVYINGTMIHLIRGAEPIVTGHPIDDPNSGIEIIRIGFFIQITTKTGR